MRKLIIARSDYLPTFSSPLKEEASLTFENCSSSECLEASMFSSSKVDPSKWKCNIGVKFSIPITYERLYKPRFTVNGTHYVAINTDEERNVQVNDKFFINNSLAYITMADGNAYFLVIEQFNEKKTVTIPLSLGVNVIGRQHNLEITDIEISRDHLKVTIKDGIVLENISKSGGVYTLKQNPQLMEDSSLTIRVFSQFFLNLRQMTCVSSKDLDMLNTIVAQSIPIPSDNDTIFGTPKASKYIEEIKEVPTAPKMKKEEGKKSSENITINQMQDRNMLMCPNIKNTNPFIDRSGIE